MEPSARIVLATDFGVAADQARRDAARLAVSYGAEIHVVHARAWASLTAESEHVIEERTRGHLLSCQLALEALGAPHVETHVAHGSAAEAILHLADSLQAEWLVLGAGNRLAGATFTGATAETVARFAAQRVWVSRGHAPDAPRSIVCGIDWSDCSREALHLANDLCTRFGARLHVVHASEAPELGPDQPPEEVTADLRRAEETTRRFLGSCSVGGEHISVSTLHGRADRALRDFVETHRADLLVLGRTGPGGLRRVFLGATAERLLRGVPCSLLLTNPAPRDVLAERAP